jgi:hypothetical protein
VSEPPPVDIVRRSFSPRTSLRTKHCGILGLTAASVILTRRNLLDGTGSDGPSTRGRYDGRMQSIEIDPELNRLALAEAVQKYPEFAEHALRVIARPLSRGFAWQLEWKGAPPPGQQAWEFQNTAIQAYKRLARIAK